MNRTGGTGGGALGRIGPTLPTRKACTSSGYMSVSLETNRRTPRSSNRRRGKNESHRYPIDATKAEKDEAYRQRNVLVAALARLYPSGTRKTNIEGWSEDWHGCVYIDLPAGQVSYHYHDSQAHLFAGLPPYEKPWDGHDKEEAERRLSAVSAKTPPHDLMRMIEDYGDSLNKAGHCVTIDDAMPHLNEATAILEKIRDALSTERKGPKE